MTQSVNIFDVDFNIIAKVVHKNFEDLFDKQTDNLVQVANYALKHTDFGSDAGIYTGGLGLDAAYEVELGRGRLAQRGRAFGSRRPPKQPEKQSCFAEAAPQRAEWARNRLRSYR